MKVEQRPADSKSKEALTDKASLLNLYREMLLEKGVLNPCLSPT